MTTFRAVMFLAASAFLVACGATDTTGTGGGGGTSCSSTHECVNGACKCTSGTKNGSSCCDPSDSSCSTSQQCPEFCKTCM